MSTNAQTEYRYNRLTWPEMNDAIAAQKLIILPTASTEQHGKHLPLDVDTFLCESVCERGGIVPWICSLTSAMKTCAKRWRRRGRARRSMARWRDDVRKCKPVMQAKTGDNS